MFPSAEELGVVLTLLELADLILERRQPPPVESLRWAGRKPRSVAFRRRRPLQTSSTPPPLVGKERDAAAVAASSPTTPLSFQESGSEDADARPDPGTERRKRSREVSLPLSFRNCVGEEGVPLAEPRREHGKRRWKSIAREDRKSFSNTSSSIFSNQSQSQSHQATKQREAVPIAGGAVDPMPVEPRWPAAVSAWVHPTSGDGHRGQQQSTRAAVGLPDLNASPTEEEEQPQQEEEDEEEDRVWGWQQRQQQLMAYRAATSLARRRRVQIQREKKSSLLLPCNSK